MKLSRRLLSVVVVLLVVSCSPATPRSWRPTGNMTEARSQAAAAVLRDGRVLMAGGVDAGTIESSAELYDPATGRWTVTGSMNVAREAASATLLRDGSVLIAGGYGPRYPEMLDSAELFDPATGTFSLVGRMAEPRNEHTATLLDDGRVLLVGRVSVIHISGDTTEKDRVGPYPAEIFDPSTKTFSPAGPGLPQLEFPTATLLEDGRVLIAGGDQSLAGGVSAYLFDPGDGSFAPTGPMVAPRQNATATRLRDGRVLIAGGFGNAGQLTSAELYDPGKGTFSLTGSIDSPRQYAAATLLRDGRVLILGGMDIGSGARMESSALTYDPSTGAFSSAGAISRPFGYGSLVALATGDALAAGGDDGQFVFASCELFRS